MLFGPDSLPYKDALQREWDRVSPGKMGENNRRKAAIGVAPTVRTGYSRDSRKTAYRPSDKETKTMAPRTRTAKAAEVAPEPEENGEKDYTVYADKDITFTMESFADWLLEVVYPEGYPGDEDDFRKGVSLGGSLRMEFQRSEWWAEVREEHDAEVAEAKAAAPAKAKKATKATSKVALETPEEDPEDPEEAEPEAPAPKPRAPRRGAAAAATPAKAPRRGAAAPAAAPKAPRARRGATAQPAEAPF